MATDTIKTVLTLSTALLEKLESIKNGLPDPLENSDAFYNTLSSWWRSDDLGIPTLLGSNIEYLRGFDKEIKGLKGYDGINTSELLVTLKSLYDLIIKFVNDTTFNHGAPTGDIFFRGQPFMFTHLQELKVKTHDFNGQLKRLIGEAVRQENNLIKQLQKLA